jgi:hypothetical protein
LPPGAEDAPKAGDGVRVVRGLGGEAAGLGQGRVIGIAGVEEGAGGLRADLHEIADVGVANVVLLEHRVRQGVHDVAVEPAFLLLGEAIDGNVEQVR